ACCTSAIIASQRCITTSCRTSASAPGAPSTSRRYAKFMSVSTPVRPTEAIPYAESQPQRQLRHASPEWLPVIGWFVDDGHRHSRINVVPLGNTTDPHERFAANLKF